MTDVRIFNRLGRPALPPISENDRATARRSPGKWFYYVDPAVSRDGPIFPENVMSGRKADDAGNVSEEYWMNDGFIPAPSTAGINFANEFELIFWRTMKGYCRAGDFVRGLSGAELLAVALEDMPDKAPLKYEGEERVLEVYTSAKFLPADTNPFLRISLTGMYILDYICPIENTVIHFNPGGAPSMGLWGSMILSLWNELKEVEAQIKADEERGIAFDVPPEPGRPRSM